MPTMTTTTTTTLYLCNAVDFYFMQKNMGNFLRFVVCHLLMDGEG